MLETIEMLLGSVHVFLVSVPKSTYREQPIHDWVFTSTSFGRETVTGHHFCNGRPRSHWGGGLGVSQVWRLPICQDCKSGTGSPVLLDLGGFLFPCPGHGENGHGKLKVFGGLRWAAGEQLFVLCHRPSVTVITVIWIENSAVFGVCARNTECRKCNSAGICWKILPWPELIGSWGCWKIEDAKNHRFSQA